jgi:vacuolar-type H+-ATPase subunit I/STV1
MDKDSPALPLKRLGEIADIIDSRPVMSYWPHMRAAEDAQLLRDAQSALAAKDAELKAWLNERATAIEQLEGVLAQELMKRDARIERLTEALKVTEQALREVRHAQECGAEWYTRGERGLYMQVRMWVNKGFEAIKLASTEAPGAEQEKPTP